MAVPEAVRSAAQPLVPQQEDMLHPAPFLIWLPNERSEEEVLNPAVFTMCFSFKIIGKGPGEFARSFFRPRRRIADASEMVY